MEANVTLAPVNVTALGADGKMLDPSFVAHLIEEALRLGGDCPPKRVLDGPRRDLAN